MALFIFAIIFAVLALIPFAVSFFVPRIVDEGTRAEWKPRKVLRWVTFGTAFVSAFFLFFSSWTTVGTKNVAVLTVAGRPVSYLDNGFHWKAPWEKPHEISDAVQTDTYASDPGHQDKRQGGATANCVNVRIERAATACINVSIRWQIRPDGVDYLYRNFKSNDHITDNVVLRDLQTAMNTSFATYDPLGLDRSGNSTNLPYSVYAAKVQRQMRDEIGQWIDVQSVLVPFMNYDDATQQKVNQLLQQIALTRVAQQAEQTALAQAKANHALSASVSNDPNVLVSKCLDILKEAVDKNQALPAGFSCFGPSTTGVAVGVK